MTSFVKPKIRRTNEPLNELGLARADYEGAMSTLCAGCGHDSVTGFNIEDLTTFSREMSDLSGVAYAGVGR